MNNVIKVNQFVFISRATWIFHILAIWCLLFMDSSKRRHFGSASINILYWVKYFIYSAISKCEKKERIWHLKISISRCGAGGLMFPPLSGFVFTSSWWGPQGILHLTLIACIKCSLKIIFFI